MHAFQTCLASAPGRPTSHRCAPPFVRLENTVQCRPPRTCRPHICRQSPFPHLCVFVFGFCSWSSFFALYILHDFGTTTVARMSFPPYAWPSKCMRGAHSYLAPSSPPFAVIVSCITSATHSLCSSLLPFSSIKRLSVLWACFLFFFSIECAQGAKHATRQSKFPTSAGPHQTGYRLAGPAF